MSSAPVAGLIRVAWSEGTGALARAFEFVSDNSAQSLETVQSAQVVNRSAVASLVFLVWDILITTDEEVKHIWPNPWSPLKLLYLYVRYAACIIQISLLFVGTELTALFHFSPKQCYIWQVYQPLAAASVIIATDFVLIFRMQALYHGSRWIRPVLFCMVVLEITAMALGVGLGMDGLAYDSNCLVTQVPTIFLLTVGAPIVFQTVLFCMTAFKFLDAVRAGWGDVPIVVILMRDGTWAFFLIFVVLMGDVGLYAAPKASVYSAILYPWLLTCFSFSGYRILLNLTHISRPHNSFLSRTQEQTGNLVFTTQPSGFGRRSMLSSRNDDALLP